MPPSDKKIVKLQTPLNQKALMDLKAGDKVLLSGKIFTARDQAHQRLNALIKANKKLPLPLKSQVIYYCGPTKKAPGKVIGSCGPTTSRRMDAFVAPLLNAGLKGMIGKGDRSPVVRALIKKHKAVYFLATGGAGAFLSLKVKKARLICFKDLGPEAVLELLVKDFPLIVGIDAKGGSAYDQK